MGSKQVDKFSIRKRADAGLARRRREERAYDSLLRELTRSGHDVVEEILQARSTGPAARRDRPGPGLAWTGEDPMDNDRPIKLFHPR